MYRIDSQCVNKKTLKLLCLFIPTCFLRVNDYNFVFYFCFNYKCGHSLNHSFLRYSIYFVETFEGNGKKRNFANWYKSYADCAGREV